MGQHSLIYSFKYTASPQSSTFSIHPRSFYLYTMSWRRSFLSSRTTSRSNSLKELRNLSKSPEIDIAEPNYCENGGGHWSNMLPELLGEIIKRVEAIDDSCAAYGTCCFPHYIRVCFTNSSKYPSYRSSPFNFWKRVENDFLLALTIFSIQYVLVNHEYWKYRVKHSLWKVTLKVLEFLKTCIVSISHSQKMGEIVVYLLLSDSSVHNALFLIVCITTPTLEVKSRMMGDASYKGTIDCFVKTLKNDGPFAFYKGFIPNFGRLGSWNVIMFLTLEQDNDERT
ncbi:hypothetical protein L1987_45980 [Smallanthus sonchifolius]|uniref:Uncharacterized protein n=1 Tax=Smallanthus sonchifolius TaxID=185202 RepID=A0ACB9FZH6_9ASTR|nr:hypothetical protein L1987_45980 [Smallanthus sonchifolius]